MICRYRPQNPFYIVQRAERFTINAFSSNYSIYVLLDIGSSVNNSSLLDSFWKLLDVIRWIHLYVVDICHPIAEIGFHFRELFSKSLDECRNTSTLRQIFGFFLGQLLSLVFGPNLSEIAVLSLLHLCTKSEFTMHSTRSENMSFKSMRSHFRQFLLSQLYYFIFIRIAKLLNNPCSKPNFYPRKGTFMLIPFWRTLGGGQTYPT